MSDLDPIPNPEAIVEEVRGLLLANQSGRINQTQFETQRSTLLLSAEAQLINRREVLLSSIASGEISGSRATECKAQMSRSEDALREAASLVGLTKAAPKAEAPSRNGASTPPVGSGRTPSLLEIGEEPTLEFVSAARPKTLRSLIPLDRPEVGFLVRRVGAVLPSVSGAVVFSPIGVLMLAGQLDGWMPIWGVVLLLLSLGCVLSARERWENPGPT